MIRRNAELEARLIDDLLDFTRVCNGRLQLNPEVIDAHVPIRHALEVCDADILCEGAGPGRGSRGGSEPRRLRPGEAAASRLEPYQERCEVYPRRRPRDGPYAGLRRAGGRRTTMADPRSRRYGHRDRPGPLAPDLRRFRARGSRDGSTFRRARPGPGDLPGDRRGPRRPDRRVQRAERAGARTFRVELATVPTPAFPEPSVVPTDGCTARPNLRVLLVEDNPDSREAVSRLLRGEGFAIETACDIRSAIALAGSRDFDVLVSDIDLPDGSGLELIACAPRPRKWADRGHCDQRLRSG